MKRLLLMLLMLPVFAEGQIITTIAGNGTEGFSGDGGPATSAALAQPSMVKMDRKGNLIIVDYTNNRLRQVSTSGIVTTIAGIGLPFAYAGDGGPATAADFGFIMGIAIDSQGNIFISDVGNNRIRKIDTTGIVTTIAGTGINGNTGDGGAASSAELSPAAITIDISGNLLFLDYPTVRKINTSGIISTIHAFRDRRLQDITTDSIGDVYVSDSANVLEIDTSGMVTVIAGNGINGYSGDGGAATNASLNWPKGMVFDDAGNLYIADNSNYRIRKVTASGIISTIAGNGTPGFAGDGGPAIYAEFDDAVGICFDTSGNMFLADFNNQRIRKITSATSIGTAVSTVAINTELKLYPNPTTTSLIITAIKPITIIGITNLLGQTVYTHDYNTSQITIDVSNLSTGMYLIKINGTEVRKFVKE